MGERSLPGASDRNPFEGQRIEVYAPPSVEHELHVALLQMLNDPTDFLRRATRAYFDFYRTCEGVAATTGHTLHRHRFDVVIRDDAHMRLLGCSNQPLPDGSQCAAAYQWDW